MATVLDFVLGIIGLFMFAAFVVWGIIAALILRVLGELLWRVIRK